MQAERDLQREVMVRVRHAPVDALVLPVPNGFFAPARTEAERTLVRRLVYRMKTDGMMVPGIADLLVLWHGGCGCIELKRAAVKTLLGSVAVGRQSKEQAVFDAKCAAKGIPYRICSSWAEVRDTLIEWGRLPAGYTDPENRIGWSAA